MSELLARLHANATDAWFLWGMLGQGMFFSRFFVQWVASERAKRSIIPTAFWYLSLAGSFVLMTYALFGRQDPVIAIGQSTGFIIYIRNLMFISRGKREELANG